MTNEDKSTNMNGTAGHTVTVTGFTVHFTRDGTPPGAPLGVDTEEDDYFVLFPVTPEMRTFAAPYNVPFSLNPDASAPAGFSCDVVKWSSKLS